MANRILVYDAGKNVGIEGTATGQVLSWNDSTSVWELTTPSGSGTVTSVTAGTGLSGGTITTSGTISADFGTTSGKIAQGNDSRFPPAPSAAGQIIYDTGSAWQALAAGTEGKVLTAHGAASPTWETPAASGVTSITAGTGLSGGTITTSGTIALAALDPAPTGSYGSASAVPAITVDAYGRVTGVVSTNIAIAASAITSGTLGVARGGTGLATLPANEVLVGNGTSALQSIALGNGELIIGHTGNAPAAATLTAGTGVAITNGAHSITIGIGQEVGTADSPTFTGLTLSGATASRFVYFNASKALTAISDGASKLIGYDTSSEPAAITLGDGLTMTGATLATVPHGTLGVVNGGTGAATLTQYAVLLGAGTSAVATAAPGTAGQVLTSNGASANPTFQSLPYDVSGEAAGTPDPSTTIFHFKAGRAWTLKDVGSVAGCEVKPSGNTSLTIAKNGSTIGSIDYTNANTTGSVDITGSADITFAIGDVLTVTTPANLNAMEAPFWTFLGTCP